MARRSSSTAVQEELYPLPRCASEHDAPEREFDDARLVDLEADQESPFLRRQRRVSVRRGSLPKKTANLLKWLALALVILAVLGASAAVLYRYGKHSWRFRIDSSDQIEVSGAQHVSHGQIMEVMGGDIGRNIFFIPLAQRQHQLEQIPWVESASVLRFVPNRLRIEVHERTPVAFARIGSRISLIDAGGYLMELAPGGKHKYSFPVIDGMNAGEPLSTRSVRMKNYNELMRQLDSSGAHYSQEISEVDITDTEDVKVLTSDPNGEVLVHLGTGNYLQRYRIFVTHVQAWRQQFTKLDSVDLRFDGQIIVNPDLEGMARQPTLTQAAAKAALAAGVKNAAIVNYGKFVTHPAPPSGPTKKPEATSKAVVKSESKPAIKAESKTVLKAGSRTVVHHAAVKSKAKGKNSVSSRASAEPASSKARTAGKVPPDSKSTLTTTSTAPSAATKVVKPVSPPASPVVTVGQKKPSAAIPKENPQN